MGTNQPNLIKTRSEILKRIIRQVQNDGRFCLHELTRYTRCECPMNRIGQNCAELAPQIAGPTPESYPVIAITALSFSAIAIVLIGLCYIRYKAKTDDTVKKRYMSRLV